MPVELGRTFIDRVNDDGPGTELTSATYTAAKGVYEEMTTEMLTLIAVVKRQASQEHNGHWVRHTPPETRRCFAVSNGAHGQRVIANHGVTSAQYVCGSGAGGGRDVRRLTEPTVEFVDSGVETLEAMRTR